MKNKVIKLNIFEIERFNSVLDDFKSIYEDKNFELNSVLSSNTLESIKKDKINVLMFAILSFQDAFKNIKMRLLAFKKSQEFKELSDSSIKFVQEFGKKINKYLLESKKFISKCEEFLNVYNETNNIV